MLAVLKLILYAIESQWSCWRSVWELDWRLLNMRRAKRFWAITIITTRQLDSPRWFSQRRSPPPHFWRCTPTGLWPPNSNSAEIFRQDTNPKFHHLMFTRSEVIVSTNKQTDRQTDRQTDKQTPLNTSNALCYATTLGNHDVYYLSRYLVIDACLAASCSRSVMPLSIVAASAGVTL